MMKFRIVKKAFKDSMANNAMGRFEVIGYQRQSKSSETFTKLLTAFYNSGDFPRSASGNYGSEVKHNVTLVIEFTVSASAEMDLSILNSQTATAQEISAALSAMQDGAEKADDLMDEFFDDVFQLVHSPSLQDLGLTDYYIQDRWIDNFQKDTPQPRGEKVILTGRAQFTCSLFEEIGSETGTPGTAFDTTVNIKDDQGNNAGASGTLGG